MYKVAIHLKDSGTGKGKILSGESFTQSLEVTEGLVVLHKSKEHALLIPLANIDFCELIKDNDKKDKVAIFD